MVGGRGSVCHDSMQTEAPSQEPSSRVQEPGQDRGSGGSTGKDGTAMSPHAPNPRRKSSEIVRRFLRRVNNNPTGVGAFSTNNSDN